MGNRPIHQDDDQPSFRLAHLIGDDVGGDVVGPDGLGRTRPRQLDRREGANRRLDAVVEDGEVRGGQSAHRLPLVVEDGDVELQQLDAGAELRRGSLPLREERPDKSRATPTKLPVRPSVTHPGYFRGAILGSATVALMRGNSTFTAVLVHHRVGHCPARIHEELDLRIDDLEEELRLRLGEDGKRWLTGQLRRQTIAGDPHQHVDARRDFIGADVLRQRRHRERDLLPLET